MSSEKVNIRKFFITEGMTPEDVRKSPNATEQQKKMADIFDSDGVKGYSQREADVFNSTAIADHGKQGVSLWTRYADGSCKETKCQGDITSFKFVPQGELKPYGTTSQKANPAEKKISFDKKSYNFAELYKKCLQEIKVTSEQVNALKEKYTFNSEEAAIEYAKVYYATGSAINVIKDATGAYYNQVVAGCKKKSETATDEEKAKLKTEISDAESLLHKVRNEAQAKLDIARKNALSKCAKPEQKQTVAVKKTNSEQTPKKLTNQKHTVHTQGHNIRVVAIEYYPNGNMKRRIFKVIRANGCTPDKSRIYIENFDSREKLVSEQRFESNNIELNMNIDSKNNDKNSRKLTNEKYTVSARQHGHDIRVVSIERYPNGNMKRRILKVIQANGCTPDKSRIHIENFDSREKLVSEQRFESSNVELNMNY